MKDKALYIVQFVAEHLKKRETSAGEQAVTKRLLTPSLWSLKACYKCVYPTNNHRWEEEKEKIDADPRHLPFCNIIISRVIQQ